MNQEIMEMLKEAGADPEDAIERFMGNEELYKRFALRFPEDENYEALAAAIEKGDASEAFRAAHTLKGVCGNLSFDRLHRAAAGIVEPLRQGDTGLAAERLPEVTESYHQILQALEGWKRSAL